MKLLALDTSTDYLTLAVLDGEKIISQFHKKVSRNHSSLLIAAIDKVIKKARLKIKDIDGFIVGVGPGSFTGLRIGVTTVKALGYALRKPIVAVPTFDAIVGNVKNFRGVICPVLDARKNKVYACLYRSDGKNVKRISTYLLLPVKDLMKKVAKYDKVFFLGDALSLIGKDTGMDFIWHPRAEVIGRLGLDNFKKRKFTKPEDLEPMYLYSKECDIKGK